MRRGRAASAIVAALALCLACGERESTPAESADEAIAPESGIESPEPALEPPSATPDPEAGGPAPAPVPGPAPSPRPAPAPGMDPAPATTEPAPAPPEGPAEPAPVPAPAGLSLDELADRIKETRAIGVFTKLALKNDIDDLLAELTAYHDRGVGQLDALQRRYEALVLKLLTLLESDEPDLALALARSREEIWSRLADPDRFAEINT